MKKKSVSQDQDLGLGTDIFQSCRIINSDGTFNVTREGDGFWAPYTSLVEMSWPRFLLIVLLAYIAINTLFGIAYMMVGLEHIANMEVMDFLWADLLRATFFSIETFTTVGYGALYPTSLSAHIIASLNALVGLMSFALVTGLIFARFAKPKAHLIFSEVAVVGPYLDYQGFQFRIVNRRESKIIDVQATVVFTWIDRNGKEGWRRYAPLKLERSAVALLPLHWTVVHPIDEYSPLYGKTAEELRRKNAEFIVLIKGFDETYSQLVHTNTSYVSEEMRWNVQFKKMYSDQAGKGTILRLDEISETEPV